MAIQRQPGQPHPARKQPAEPLRRPPHRAPLHEKGAQQGDAGGEQGKAQGVHQRERFAHGDAGRQRQGKQAGGAGEREGSLKGKDAVEVAVAIQQRHEALRQRRADLHQPQPEHQPDQFFCANKALHQIVNRQHQQAAGGDGGGNARDEFHFVMVVNQLQQAGGELGEQGDADKVLQTIRLVDFEKENAHAGVSHEIRRLNPAALLQIERQIAAQLRQRGGEQPVLEARRQREQQTDGEIGEPPLSRMIGRGGRTRHKGHFMRLEGVAAGLQGHGVSFFQAFCRAGFVGRAFMPDVFVWSAVVGVMPSEKVSDDVLGVFRQPLYFIGCP